MTIFDLSAQYQIDSLILSYILLSILSKTEQNMISVNKYFKLLSKCNISLSKTLCNLIQKSIDFFRVINVILILLYDQLTWYEEIHMMHHLSCIISRLYSEKKNIIVKNMCKSCDRIFTKITLLFTSFYKILLFSKLIAKLFEAT